MAKKRLQNKIATNRFSLPILAIYATIIFLVTGNWNERTWMDILCLAITTYMLMDLNKSNSLIRTYSQMVSCSFLALNLLFINHYSSIYTDLMQLFSVAFFLPYFKAYQDKRATFQIFCAFLWLGIASLFYIRILYFVPVLWILLSTNILALSGKTFGASILGIILPYWVIGGYRLYQTKYPIETWRFYELVNFQSFFNFECLDTQQITVLAFVALLSAIGIIHYLRTSYKDKIRTRMLQETFIILNLCSWILIIIQPEDFNYLIRFVVITTAPLIGHFITLTNKKATNVTFIIIMICTFLISIYNIWISS